MDFCSIKVKFFFALSHDKSYNDTNKITNFSPKVRFWHELTSGPQMIAFLWPVSSELSPPNYDRANVAKLIRLLR